MPVETYTRPSLRFQCMPESIENPRRDPRLPIRCTVRIALGTGAFFATCTSAVGTGGCGVVTPSRLQPEERVFMELKSESIAGSHMLSGQVVWSSDAPPWRSGVRFDAASRRVAAGLFERLASAHPDLAASSKLVDSVAVDAVLAPTPPPGLGSLTPVEAEVVRALGDGLEAGALPARLGERWSECVNVLFALIGRKVIEVRPPPGNGSPLT